MPGEILKLYIQELYPGFIESEFPGIKFRDPHCLNSPHFISMN